MNNIYHKLDLTLKYSRTRFVYRELLGMPKCYIGMVEFIKSYPHDKERQHWKFFVYD